MPKTRNTESKAENLGDFLSDVMYHSEFMVPVKSELKWTKSALTWACNSPETLSLKKVKQLAVFIYGDESKAAVLNRRFGAGKNNITVADLEQLTQKPVSA